MHGKRRAPGEKSGANSLTWAQTKRACDENDVVFYIDRGLALRATASGLNIGWFGSIIGMISFLGLVAGVAMAIFFSWWWLIAGTALAIACFRMYRDAAVRAVRRSAFLNEDLFYFLRDNKIIWFESRAA